MLFSELWMMDLVQQLRSMLGPVWGPGHLLSSVVTMATSQVFLEEIFLNDWNVLKLKKKKKQENGSSQFYYNKLSIRVFSCKKDQSKCLTLVYTLSVSLQIT